MNRPFQYLLALCLFFSSLGCTAQTPPASKAQRAIQQFAADPDLQNAGISFQARELSSGKVIGRHNEALSLAPASTQKLVTTASALEILGPNFQFNTQIGYSGKIQPNGVLEGDLYIIGGGDPCLASKYFPEQKDILRQWTQQIQLTSIKEIKGDVVVLDNYFATELPRTWIWEDIANYYGAIPHGASYLDNTYNIYFKSEAAGGKTNIQKIEPKEKGIEFQNQVLSSSGNRDNAYIFGGPESPIRIVKGSIPQNRNNFRVKGAMANPAQVLADELQKEIAAAGIQIHGSAKYLNQEQENTRIQKIITHSSPPINRIVYFTNQKSVNLYAEHLLLELGKQKYSKGDIESGLKAIKDFWASKEVEVKGISLYDGSGLSRFNALNADFLTQLLQYMFHSPNHKPFLHSLPIAGKSGTLENFGKRTFLENNFKAKTGSMQGVRSYAGYLVNHKGKTLAFSLIINNYNCSPAKLSDKVKHLLFKIYNC